KNAVVWNAGDDALDTDQSWSGIMDNFIVIAGPETDHALEIDGPEGAFLAGHTLRNGAIKGAAATELADFRDGIRGTFENLYFFNFPDPSVDGFGDFSLSGDATIANFAGGELNFSNMEITLSEGSALESVFKGGTHAHATSVAAGANTVGVDKSSFTKWSWADQAGEL